MITRKVRIGANPMVRYAVIWYPVSVIQSSGIITGIERIKM
jgi:hypothetical protein